MNNRKIAVLGGSNWGKAALATSLLRDLMVTHTPARAEFPNDHGDTKPMTARQIRKQRKAWKRAQKEK